MQTLKQSEINKAAEFLKKGEIIAFPTETVFGLGVIYDNKNAYDLLIKVKRRPPEKPFTLMLADPEDVEKYAKLDSASKALVKAFMPGQFTLIVDAKEDLPSWCVSSEGKIGLRVPDYDLIRNLIRTTGKPLLVPSANKSGEPPANTSDEVIKIFNNEISAVIEGASTSKIPSTIVVMNNSTPTVIRQGVVTVEAINKIIEKETSK